MDDDKKITDEGKAGEGEDETYLGSWKTKEDAEEGLKNLQGKMSEQGNEVGTLRKQNEDNTLRMDEMQVALDAGKKAGEQEVLDKEVEGVATEQAKIDKEIKDLDPVDEGYTPKLTALIRKSNALAAQGQHKKTLTAATEAFRTELDDRDVRSAHQSFDDANPDFKTPEMQARIREYIAQDKTGMSDALVAFREIQRDDLALKSKELSDQNEELMKRLNLKKGTDETGTVILKSQGNQEPKTQTKTTGAARNAGMQAVLDKQRAE
ncbi:MAG: hypothetical protein IMF11_18955 [Proteobacteria bacterium]|nr:hypothetical protein [Pseudomonadota bacterium]